MNVRFFVINGKRMGAILLKLPSLAFFLIHNSQSSKKTIKFEEEP